MLSRADNRGRENSGPLPPATLVRSRQKLFKLPAPGSVYVRRARGVPARLRVNRDEIDRAIAAHQGGGTRKCDHYALLVRFLWLTGCRISEAAAVTPQDFDFGASCVRLVTRKRRGSHHRALPLPGDFCGQLAQWIAFWRPAPDERLFPWGRSRSFDIVRRVLEAGGVERPRAHPHAIRHGHAFHALAHGVPVQVLQNALGHAHLSTTAIYATATGADLRAAYERVPW